MIRSYSASRAFDRFPGDFSDVTKSQLNQAKLNLHSIEAFIHAVQATPEDSPRLWEFWENSVSFYLTLGEAFYPDDFFDIYKESAILRQLYRGVDEGFALRSTRQPVA
ncbi:hypothetical protein IDM48_11550 (plasmid) [Rothia amarae]|uniref:Uncharacterized protein n=1 Tax=Rothia amarae TaxID=169480 RepID=A0A7S6WWP6_9MICC|nr:hypothetical protein [Rothia amarae]QOW64951.1 hypothetical protein IDM48_11550 [Rothia amarae]